MVAAQDGDRAAFDEQVIATAIVEQEDMDHVAALVGEVDVRTLFVTSSGETYSNRTLTVTDAGGAPVATFTVLETTGAPNGGCFAVSLGTLASPTPDASGPASTATG